MEAARESLNQLPPYEGPLSALVGESVWFVHPQEDACAWSGTVISICPDGKMMRIEDRRGDRSFVYIHGPFTRVGPSCGCGSSE